MTLALEIDNLKKTYHGGFTALDGISLSVKEGEFLALLGPNGAGKSTTISILNSLVRKTSGTVKIYDHDIDTNMAEAKAYLGVVPQEVNFSAFEKVLDILIYQAGYYGIPPSIARPRAEHYLKALDLWDKRDNQARRLSGGMKRRLLIARALVHDPDIIILDEPTAGVDIELRRLMWDFLRDLNQKHGKTIILTTHYLEEAEMLCERIAIINHGKLVADQDIGSFLNQLQLETFILNLQVPWEGELPHVPHLEIRLTNPLTLEIDVPKSIPLNELFATLDARHIKVLSLRNKVNRLEELFVQLTRKQNGSNDKLEKSDA